MQLFLFFFPSVLSLQQQRSLRFQSRSVIRKNSLNPDFKREATNLLCKQRAPGRVFKMCYTPGGQGPNPGGAGAPALGHAGGAGAAGAAAQHGRAGLKSTAVPSLTLGFLQPPEVLSASGGSTNGFCLDS